MLRLLHDANYDFIGFRRKAYLITAVALTISLAAGVFWAVRKGTAINYGVDFTGGTVVQVRIPQARDAGALRAVVDAAVSGTEITEFGEGEGEYLIRTPRGTSAEATTNSDAVVAALRQRFGQDEVEVRGIEAVSAKVGNELQARALLAILVSFGATLIYLAFRFEWRFGTAAVAATAHDVLLTLGLMIILRLEMSLPMVAALLTIVGYSLNDKIVVFDRIRENLKTARRTDFAQLVNRSINETLPRTLLTGGATIATLLSLFLFSGAVIREFAFLLLVGILLGTYSSMYIGCPVLLDIEKRWPGENVAKGKRPVKRPARA